MLIVSLIALYEYAGGFSGRSLHGCGSSGANFKIGGDIDVVTARFELQVWTESNFVTRK